MNSSESRAICRYLALKYFKEGGQNLTPNPKDLKATALFEQWASVELTNYDTYATVLVGQKLFGKYASRTLISYPQAHTMQGARD